MFPSLNVDATAGKFQHQHFSRLPILGSQLCFVLSKLHRGDTPSTGLISSIQSITQWEPVNFEKSS